MIPLISLAQAKRQCNVMLDDTAHDEVIYMYVQFASALVMTHIKEPVVPQEWTIGTSPQTYDIPFDVQAAVAVQAADFFMNREAGIVNILPPAVIALLRAFRTPTMA